MSERLPKVKGLGGCDLCGDFPVALHAKCHPGAPLRVEAPELGILVLYCYVPECGREVWRGTVIDAVLEGQGFEVMKLPEKRVATGDEAARLAIIVAETRLVLDGALESLGDNLAESDVHIADKARRLDKYANEHPTRNEARVGLEVARERAESAEAKVEARNAEIVAELQRRADDPTTQARQLYINLADDIATGKI